MMTLACSGAQPINIKRGKVSYPRTRSQCFHLREIVFRLYLDHRRKGKGLATVVVEVQMDATKRAKIMAV